MYLRRGIIRPLDADAGDRAIDRAMFGVVDHLHGEVEAQATRDLLTGFLARRFFVDAVDAALAGVEPASKAAVCCQLSIENLKQINDDFGTETGDGLLAMCAAAVEQALRGKDVLFGRLGGAELGVFWPAGGVQAAYKKLQAALPKLTSVTLKLDDDDDDTVELAVVDTMRSARTARAVQAEIVIGVTATDDSMIQADGLLGAAREACDSARTMGAGSIYVAGSESEQRRVLEQMVSYANKALERGSLILLGQRVTSLVDAALPPALHVAISARDRADKPIPSHLFAPAMARVSNAADIDLWGFRQTLAWMQAHEEEVEAYALVIVPLSSASMKNEDLPQRIMGEFMESPVPPGKICFEIPDRDAVENLSEVAELVNTMKEFGCRFVLDEFGSGHQNYDYIKRIAVDYVTVKTAFVNEAQKNPKDFAMAKSINELVHFMGKKTMPKQERGAHTAATMREIGIDFLYDLTERAQLAP
jgi:diguanylate cyclase (GGDEF)-like protein